MHHVHHVSKSRPLSAIGRPHFEELKNVICHFLYSSVDAEIHRLDFTLLSSTAQIWHQLHNNLITLQYQP